MGFVWKRCLEAVHSVRLWGRALDRKTVQYMGEPSMIRGSNAQFLSGKEPQYEWERILFFSGLSFVLGCLRMKVIISLSATSCQKLIKANNECKLQISFYKMLIACKSSCNSLGEKWECCMLQRVVELTNKRQGSLTCGRVYLLVRSFLVIDQGELERESESMFGAHCGCQVECFSTWLL